MGGARPPRPAVAGLGESDLVTLYSVGAVRAVAAGDRLQPESGAADTCFVVVDGRLELRLTGGSLDLGVATRGDCLTGVDAGAVPYTVIATEPSNVVELSGMAFDLLPTETQRMLSTVIAASSARRFNALATRHAAMARRSALLAASIKDRPAQARRILTLPPLRQALSEIPALPVHATGVAMKLLDDRTRADDVVESIKNDPALASLVLKRVNSAHYGLETKVSDHYRALLILGTATVYQLLLESAVESVVGDHPETRDIQTRATMISVLAYEIALASGQENPLLASTIGLLHNIGDSLSLLLRRTKPDVVGLLDLVDKPVLGGAVLAGWGLPERVHHVVERQQEAAVLLPEELNIYPADLGVLYLARVCHDVMLEGATPPAHAATYMARLGLKDTNCATFCKDVLVPALAKKLETLPAAARARLQR
jgi:HD-like signal output (HDOD) protein